MKALLIVAHGSRKKESNDEIIKMAEEMSALASDRFDYVKPSFIQFSEPTIPDQVATLRDSGVTHITVFPYFIGAGTHVLTDIPELVETVSSMYPELTVTVTEHLGKFSGLKQMILDEIG